MGAVAPPVFAPPPSLPPRNITKSIMVDRATLRRIRRVMRERHTSFSNVVYQLVLAGLPGVETESPEAERKSA